MFPINVPSLDERKEDIPPLVDNFVRKYNEKFGISKDIDEDAKEYMAGLNWPGNIRELENVTQRLMIACPNDTITLLDVMKELGGGFMDSSEVDKQIQRIGEVTDIDLTQMVESFEKWVIQQACEKYGSTRKTAKAIGISQTQLVRKKNKYGII